MNEGASTPSGEHSLELNADRRGWWGAFAGVIVATLIAFPLSAAFALATHPATQRMFGGRLESSSQFGYSLFWGLIALALLALPFLVGFGIARLTGRGLKIAMGIAALFVIAIMVLGQLFIF
jgi:amino acid transporter